jgi:hypothetical protein
MAHRQTLYDRQSRGMGMRIDPYTGQPTGWVVGMGGHKNARVTRPARAYWNDGRWWINIDWPHWVPGSTESPYPVVEARVNQIAAYITNQDEDGMGLVLERGQSLNPGDRIFITTVDCSTGALYVIEVPWEVHGPGAPSPRPPGPRDLTAGVSVASLSNRGLGGHASCGPGIG